MASPRDGGARCRVSTPGGRQHHAEGAPTRWPAAPTPLELKRERLRATPRTDDGEHSVRRRVLGSRAVLSSVNLVALPAPPIVDNVVMASLADIVVDCAQPAQLARFWSAVLDDYRIALYDDDELARLRSLGVDDVEDDPTVLVEPISGTGPRLWFQMVPELKRVKNRIHLDVRTDDFDAELARLFALGARADDHQARDDLIVLHDPEDNEFCLLRP